MSWLTRAYRDWRARRAWERGGRPTPPPPAVKRAVVGEYARRFPRSTLIETGTFHGDMVRAMKGRFGRVISIELDERLFERAVARFAGDRNVTILRGDSGVVLGELMGTIESPCLFWLDGHYSGPGTGKGIEETPVMRELRHVLDHRVRDHVILIDDAREFNGTHDYPTIEALRAHLARERPDLVFECRDDVIRLTPAG
ncbi:MAG: hypothetical protein JNL50_04515 [Phycisphaerae bacterium]|nr:hypothetical protein [Phycisphaerae bacterium]